LNVYDGLPFRVVLDYAHNPDKYKSMVEFVTSLPTKGRRIIVITSPGNREDRHFHEIAQVCAGSFDHYFLARRKDPRGRGEFEVQEIICDTLQTCSVSPDCITICNIETEAVEQALAYAQAGDTLVLAVKDNVRCWELVTSYNAEDK
jgi:cyanophycin synthetase